MMRRFEILVLLITTLAIAAVGMFLFRGDRVEARIGTEVFTLTYQFLLMIVIGSGVSVLFQTISYGRESRERRRVLQREIHQALVGGYNDAKRARRLLRARALDRRSAALPASGILLDAAEYDRQLEAISSAQLLIELAMRRVEINRNLFRNGSELLQSLENVCGYLNAVIDEWEDVRPSLSPAGPLAMARLPELEAFLRPPDASPRFRDGFKTPFDRALLLMEDALISDI